MSRPGYEKRAPSGLSLAGKHLPAAHLIRTQRPSISANSRPVNGTDLTMKVDDLTT